MAQLFQILSQRAADWRRERYPCRGYPAIAEVLEWAGGADPDATRYLRRPQLQALEVYWHLRLVAGTPRVLDLYRSLFPKPSELLPALGLDQPATRNYMLDNGFDALVERIATDDEFVRQQRLEAVRETLTLDYPSYILALAMGAGKTVLIGAIIATEFAMALEYPDGPFVHNALVFAPGLTIIEALRELAEVPYDRILPPRLHKPFAASLKLLFTRDGEKDIPVIRGSSFNAIVTNTEKIRIQKEAIRKSDLGGLFGLATDDARAEVANLRLEAIASLPHLAVFSDEAHHTYGQSMSRELKKVRKTVDYLAAKTNVIAVINTTGTPYFGRQPLRDVVYWYGLGQGIREGYLKDLSGNIHAYHFEGDAARYVAHVVEDFFREYGDVALPTGEPAKLAIYFPQTDDVRQLRPVIEAKLAEMGIPPTVILEHHTANDEKEEFDRFRLLSSTKRLALLVDRGTEGWNCPCLFACALARKLRTSNNFVLQATTRCLRQVPGNHKKARVYLSMNNYNILDRQLQETYGESIWDLSHHEQEMKRAKVVVKKLDIPPLVITQIVRTVVRKAGEAAPLALRIPTPREGDAITQRRFTIEEQHASYRVLRRLGDDVRIESAPSTTDAYAAAVDLAARYRLPLWTLYDELRRLYGAEDIPLSHLDGLAEQIEAQTRLYEVLEERRERALALIKPKGFKAEPGPDGTEVYTAEIMYPKDRERYLAHLARWRDKAGVFGFHYDPYNFDSMPEMNFFEEILREINLKPEEVEDIYFTGAISDPAKTDFFVEYKDDKGDWRRYTPDFIIRKRPGRGRKRGTGRTYIVKIKREHDRSHPIDGAEGRKAMAIRQWTGLDPERLRYEMVFTAGDNVPPEGTRTVRQFIQEPEP